MDIMYFLSCLTDQKKISEYFISEAKNSSWSNIFRNVLAFACVNAIFTILLFVLSPIMSPNLYGPNSIYGHPAPSFATALLSSFIIAILSAIFFFLSAGLLHVVSKFFGGNGRYVVLLYLLSIMTVFFTVLSQIIDLLNLFPAISIAVTLLLLVLSIFEFYVNFKLIKSVYGVDRNTAIKVLLISIFIWLLVFTILFGIYVLISLPKNLPA